MTKTPTLLDDLDNCAQYRVSADEDAAYARVRDFIQTNMPWYPPQQEGYGPWIEYREDEPGPCVNDMVHIMTPVGRINQDFGLASLRAKAVNWANVVAYCVKQDKP